MNNKYTVDYFIEKFLNIPDKLWCTKELFNNVGQHCALGHCGTDATYDNVNYEAKALSDIFSPDFVSEVNDGKPKYKRLGKTPKERIINALKKINSGEFL